MSKRKYNGGTSEEQRNGIEKELINGIEQLEIQQIQDDSVLNYVNRFCNQCDNGEFNTKNEREVSRSEIEEFNGNLTNEVQDFQREVAKVIQNVDGLMQSNEKNMPVLDRRFEGDGAPSMDDTVRLANSELQTENQKLQTLNASLHKENHLLAFRLANFRLEFHNILEKTNKLETYIEKTKDKLKRLEATQIDKRIIPKQDTQTSLLLQKTYGSKNFASNTKLTENSMAIPVRLAPIGAPLEKTYTCTYCDKSFSKKSNFEFHLKYHKSMSKQ